MHQENDSDGIPAIKGKSPRDIGDKKKFFKIKKTAADREPTTQMVSGNAFREEKRMAALGMTFTVTKTNATTKISFPGKDRQNLIFTSKRFTVHEFNLFRDVKLEVLANIEANKIKIPEYTAKDIGYYLFGNDIHRASQTGFEEFTDIWEFDIRMAYYMAARNLGYISDEYYTLCVDLPKMIRLRLIGSIATSKHIYTYINGKLHGEPQIDENDKLRFAWFHICKYVDTCLRDFRKLLGEDFLFYWVDGIYTKKSDKIDHYLLYMSIKYGFDFATQNVDRIVCKQDDENKYVKISVYKEGKPVETPTVYYLNNDGETDRELKEFYVKNFM